MKLLLPASAVALLVSLAAAAELEPNNSRSPASDAIVLLLVNTPKDKGLGEAFAIGDGSLLVAARHVVFSGNEASEFETLGLLTVFSPYLGELREARLVAEDEESDLAILRWSGKGHPALALASDEEVRSAQAMDVMAWADLGRAMAEYDISATTRPASTQVERLAVDFLGMRGQQIRTVQLMGKRLMVQKGWSGSPAIVSGTTKVAGMVRSITMRGGRPITVETSSSAMMRSLLEKCPNQQATQPTGATRATSRPADAERIRAATLGMWMHWGKMQKAQAREDLKQLIAARPENPLYRSRAAIAAADAGDANADALFKEAIATGGGTLETRVYFSQYLIERDRYDEALAVLDEVKRLEPRGTLWAIGVYNAHERQKKQAQVVDAMQEAVKIAPCDGMAWINLGQAQHAAKDDRAAVESFERAMALMPKLTEVRMLLAQSLDRSGQTQRAEAMFRQWVRDQSDNAAAHLMLAQFLARNEPGNLPEALREAESALALPMQPGGPPVQLIKSLAEHIRAELAKVAASQPASRSMTTAPAARTPASRPSASFKL